MTLKRMIVAAAVALLLGGIAAVPAMAEVDVTDVTARQRYPWNALVDITCKVTGIDGETNGLKLAVAAVMPDSGNVRNVSHFWVVQGGTNSVDCEVHTNGNYRLLWDARADLGIVRYSNMVVRISFDSHENVQLWEDGPYWATTNIGAEKPEDYGYYFWWGDTVGYKREGNAWVASNGALSDFSFSGGNTLTFDKNLAILRDEGWITADGVLSPEHDAANVHWGGGWRMPMIQELSNLVSNCDWTWASTNGVGGYEIRGRGDYASACIFLPAAGEGGGSGLSLEGRNSRYWSSAPASEQDYRYFSWLLDNGDPNCSCSRLWGHPIRPVQGFTGSVAMVEHAGDSAPFLLDTRDGTRITREIETIAYSVAWEADAPVDAVAVVEVNGLRLSLAAGSGYVNWAAMSNGTYTLTHKVMSGETQYGATLTATFVVTEMPSAFTTTQTTEVPVPYVWLRQHAPDVTDEYEAYEAAAKATAANGRKVWECYALGLDPQVETNDFRIVSFPMKADGTPDFANVAFDPPQEQWNVPDAPVVWKGAEQLEGPWRTVSAEDGSPGTARPTMQFFKAVVFGSVEDDEGGVQLWEGGPYWAECNVGATRPEEYGYYFWWGDTVGYTNTGSGWISVKDGTSISFSSSSGTAASTYGKSNSALQSAGYIDSTGNLVAAHDAATAHLGSPWRMPTDAEFSALVSNCTTTWITTNGVSGRLVTGKGAYANRSIFLPAAGYGNYSSLDGPGSFGFYWSSSPYSDDSYGAWSPGFSSSYFGRGNYDRDDGQSVRPVRGFAQ